MNCTNFNFNNETSEDHGVIICSFGTSNDTVDAGSKVEFTLVNVPNSSRVIKTNSSYKEQLQIQFSICKNFCESETDNFSMEDQRDIMRWLLRKDFKYINFEQDGFENVYYNVQIQLEQQRAGCDVVGYNVTCTCDAPWGWSEEITTSLTSQSSLLFNGTDEPGITYPYTVLTVTATGNISIQNNETGSKTVVNNCTKDEVITFDEFKHIMTNNKNHSSIYNDFNDVFPEIYCTYNSADNEFTLVNCTAVMKWREARKVVV